MHAKPRNIILVYNLPGQNLIEIRRSRKHCFEIEQLKSMTAYLYFNYARRNKIFKTIKE